MRVKFVDLGLQYKKLRREIIAKFDEISLSGNYILGSEVNEFEDNFAKYCGVQHAIALGNGSDALLLPLLSLNLSSSDEVLIPPNSFIATAWTVARAGAKIVFVDVKDDFNINPALIEKAITPRTKVIMPVHLTGRIADMDSIIDIANAHNLIVIEDAAQAVGARYKGRRSGSFGYCAGFSLHPLKNLHVYGDGGVAVTNDVNLKDKLMKFRNHGLRSRDECEFWGINSRLDAVSAAIANIKMKYIDEWNDRFRQIARIYSENINQFVNVPVINDYEEPIFHRYMICADNRDELAEYLAANGIETRINYPIPLHLQEASKYLGYKQGDFPVAERLSKTILSLPLYAEMSDEKVYYVIEKVMQYFKGRQYK